MKNRIYTIAFFLVAAIIVSVTFVACSDSGATSEKNEKKKDDSKFVLVETQKLKFEPFTSYITVIGTAKSDKSANLSADEGGKIKSFLKDKGSYVKKDEVILILDNDVIKANMDAAKAQFDLAEVNFQKQEKIYKQNASSEIQYLQAKYQRDAASANYELMKARYDRTFVKATFNGYIDNKFYEEGELAPPGLPIVTLINTDVIKVTAGISEAYISDVNAGDQVKIIFKDLNNAEYKGRISFVGKTIITSNRTFPVDVVISNPGNKIKPELNAELNIETGNFQEMIVIPENVIVRTDLGYVVFVAEKDKAKMKSVKVQSRKNNRAAIASGLTAGDELIVTGYQGLIDGENIKVVK